MSGCCTSSSQTANQCACVGGCGIRLDVHVCAMPPCGAWCVGGGVMERRSSPRSCCVSVEAAGLRGGALPSRLANSPGQTHQRDQRQARRMLSIAVVLHQGLVGCLFVQFRGTCQPDDGTQTQAGGWRAPTCSSQAGRHRRAGGDLAHCGAGQTPNTARRCTTTPRQARPDTTDIVWTHGTTADPERSGG